MNLYIFRKHTENLIYIQVVTTERLALKLSERERKVLDTIATSDDAKSAAEELELSPSTVYNMLYRIRKKYVESRQLVNTVLSYRRRSKTLDMVLSKRLTIKEE